MDDNDTSNNHAKLPDGADGLSRRNVLMRATVTAGALAAVPGVMADTVLADTIPGGNFGAPVVELHVPGGVLTLEQRSAMIKGITDVVLGALKQPPDPAKRLFVAIYETAEGGFGINGKVLVPLAK
jgi:phenylpyruvate tautomerase PptA (4-oxalocrotonate tautomerase family)